MSPTPTPTPTYSESMVDSNSDSSFDSYAESASSTLSSTPRLWPTPTQRSTLSSHPEPASKSVPNLPPSRAELNSYSEYRVCGRVHVRVPQHQTPSITTSINLSALKIPHHSAPRPNSPRRATTRQAMSCLSCLAPTQHTAICCVMSRHATP